MAATMAGQASTAPGTKLPGIRTTQVGAATHRAALGPSAITAPATDGSTTTPITRPIQAHGGSAIPGPETTQPPPAPDGRTALPVASPMPGEGGTATHGGAQVTHRSRTAPATSLIPAQVGAATHQAAHGPPATQPTSPAAADRRTTLESPPESPEDLPVASLLPAQVGAATHRAARGPSEMKVPPPPATAQAPIPQAGTHGPATVALPSLATVALPSLAICKVKPGEVEAGEANHGTAPQVAN